MLRDVWFSTYKRMRAEGLQNVAGCPIWYIPCPSLDSKVCEGETLAKWCENEIAFGVELKMLGVLNSDVLNLGKRLPVPASPKRWHQTTLLHSTEGTNWRVLSYCTRAPDM